MENKELDLPSDEWLQHTINKGIISMLYGGRDVAQLTVVLNTAFLPDFIADYIIDQVSLAGYKWRYQSGLSYISKFLPINVYDHVIMIYKGLSHEK